MRQPTRNQRSRVASLRRGGWVLRSMLVAFVLADLGVAAYIMMPKPPPQPETADVPFKADVAQQHQANWAYYLEVPVSEFNDIGMAFNLIPPGTFVMGSASTEPAFKKREGPQHEVTISKPFYISTTEVTVAQFRQFVGATNYQINPERSNAGGSVNYRHGRFVKHADYPWDGVGYEQDETHPVTNVSWFDAISFCRWLSEMSGKPHRLPYEAEWEHACRAGADTIYHTGDALWRFRPMANMADQSLYPGHNVHIEDGAPWDDSFAHTAPVASFPPNAFGLYDMHGNLREWCMDWCLDDYFEQSPALDPHGPEHGAARVLKGGNWGSNEYYCRTGRRMARIPSDRNTRNGFRVVRELTSDELQPRPATSAPSDHAFN